MALSVFWSSAWFLVVIALFYGIGNTCQSITAPSLVSGVFGVRNYSEVYAKISTVTMVVGAVSTPVLSAIYEASGSYLTAWIVCLVLSFVSTVCLMAACMGHDRVKNRGEKMEILVFICEKIWIVLILAAFFTCLAKGWLKKGFYLTNDPESDEGSH